MDVADLKCRLERGDRRALSRAITLVESDRAAHRDQAARLLEALAGAGAGGLRLGLSGPPGVGKSTFIEALGTRLTGEGHKVAVLAVDPSSASTGGAILGDKTRMERLARDPAAFIRPSPSRAHLGGVARRTREAMRLCEAAGFDVVIVETVGVGQSETQVADMTDIFVVLLAPAGGDELQGVKRGVVERADLLVVNKADAELARAAERTAADYRGALALRRRAPDEPAGHPTVLTLSAATGRGIGEAWAAIGDLARERRDSGAFVARRARQSRRWFEEEVRAGLIDRLQCDPDLAAAMATLAGEVAEGRRAPRAAAREVVDRAIGRGPGA